MTARSARRRPSPEMTVAQAELVEKGLLLVIAAAGAHEADVARRALAEWRRAWGIAGVEHGLSPHRQGET